MAERQVITLKMESEIRFNTSKEIRNEPKNLDSEDRNLFAHEFKLDLPKVFKIELDNINVLRNTIFYWREFKFYKSLTHIFDTPNKYFWKRLRLLLTSAQHRKQGIWITDEISSEYFHWFTDALTRLKAIESTYESKEMLQKNFSVILPDFYKTKPYIEYSLREMGYTPFYFNPKKRLKVQKLISATHTAPTGNYNSLLISKIHDSLRLENKGFANRKIYISRAKATKRTVLNEIKVIQLLQTHGYEIHSFEDYSFQKQLEIMSDTKVLVGIHGAGLTNMLFMSRGAKVLELRNEGDSHNNCYFSLASALSHDYYYLNNEGDREDTNSVNLTVDIDQLNTVLRQMN